MTQIKKDEVREKILLYAKEEFLDKGFEKTSIRAIAAKAGITSGTIYTYFKNKNEVFVTIVMPALYALFTQMEKTMTGFSAKLDNIALAFSKEMGHLVITRFLNMIYEGHDDFMLLFKCSNGSTMENFKDTIIDKYTSLCLSLLKEISKSQAGEKTFSASSVHVILSLFFTIVEDILTNDMTRNEAEQHKSEWAGIIFGAWNGLINY